MGCTNDRQIESAIDQLTESADKKFREGIRDAVDEARREFDPVIDEGIRTAKQEASALINQSVASLQKTVEESAEKMINYAAERRREEADRRLEQEDLSARFAALSDRIESVGASVTIAKEEQSGMEKELLRSIAMNRREVDDRISALDDVQAAQFESDRSRMYEHVADVRSKLEISIQRARDGAEARAQETVDTLKAELKSRETTLWQAGGLGATVFAGILVGGAWRWKKDDARMDRIEKKAEEFREEARSKGTEIDRRIASESQEARVQIGRLESVDKVHDFKIGENRRDIEKLQHEAARRDERVTQSFQSLHNKAVATSEVESKINPRAQAERDRFATDIMGLEVAVKDHERRLVKLEDGPR
ncbi:MAG: hypothetical protein RBS39_00290 [Phycisphaerales bacterium]|nr:hypothetical protein [Phycisphaerales bacterium]